ncbi:uncharacterized protein LOC124286034 [Haliotis rubra]|uniref:uncharacterized protein LOC124286034 n=1 Tax=Haliotis rubra TaxID=36100 RepID=UPI001EE5EACF|nr:uncharacterized protein LOC124286034 [Haliotis rubra]
MKELADLPNGESTWATSTSAINDLHTSLSSTLDPQLFSSLRTAQTTANNKLDTSTKTGHIKKLQELTASGTKRKKTTAPTTAPTINNTVVNLSKIQLTNQQVSTLAKGLKFAPASPKINSDMFIANIEKGLQQLAPGGKVDFLRHQITSILHKAQPQKPNITPAEKQAIRQLKQHPDIVIAPADKGRATVVLDKDHFHSMVDNLLDDTSTYQMMKRIRLQSSTVSIRPR